MHIYCSNFEITFKLYNIIFSFFLLLFFLKKLEIFSYVYMCSILSVFAFFYFLQKIIIFLNQKDDNSIQSYISNRTTTTTTRTKFCSS